MKGMAWRHAVTGGRLGRSNCCDFGNEICGCSLLFVLSLNLALIQFLSLFVCWIPYTCHWRHTNKRSLFFKRNSCMLLNRPQVQLMWWCMTGCGAEPNKWQQTPPPTHKLPPRIITPWTEVRSKRRMLWLQGVQIYNSLCEWDSADWLLYMLQQGAWYVN